MGDVTTIQLEKGVVDLLKKNKEYARQSYNDLILDMIKVFGRLKKNNQYDRFLHTIQQAKMKELWDNKEDEVWENA